ncbi:hypothetical protein MTO96_006223 [Rhipicephalus appendiculatus]
MQCARGSAAVKVAAKTHPDVQCAVQRLLHGADQDVAVGHHDLPPPSAAEKQSCSSHPGVDGRAVPFLRPSGGKPARRRSSGGSARAERRPSANGSPPILLKINACAPHGANLRSYNGGFPGCPSVQPASRPAGTHF